MHSIPVIDFGHYGSDPDKSKDLANAVGCALRDVGFFALKNHAIAPSLIKECYALMESLFAKKEEILKKYEIPGLRGQRGYTSFMKEHAKDNPSPDLKEFWHVGQEDFGPKQEEGLYPKNIWPEDMPLFKEKFTDLYVQLEKVAKTLLRLCAQFLEEPASDFGEMATYGNSILRLIHYPPLSGKENPKSIRAAAHEDINLITLLIAATASGLQIKTQDGSWLDVVTPEGCIIVDSGDMLQNITNGYFKSTTHRVINPEGVSGPRYSIPFFVHPRSKVDLSPLSQCIEKTGGQKVHPSINASAFLAQRLKEIGLA